MRLEQEKMRPENEKINIAPGGRIAQAVERDPHRHIWNDGKPLFVWRIKIVDYDAIRNAAHLPPLPTLHERPWHREGPPPLDTSWMLLGYSRSRREKWNNPRLLSLGRLQCTRNCLL